MGAGRIGGEVAFLAAATGLVDELVLHDAIAPFLHAQVLDLQHTGLDLMISTDLRDAASADLGVFAAGSPRNPNIRSRADLLAANLPVADDCITGLSRFPGVMVAITNPSDANAYYITRKSGLDRSRVLGFGGQLDSARFGLALREPRAPARPAPSSASTATTRSRSSPARPRAPPSPSARRSSPSSGTPPCP